MVVLAGDSSDSGKPHEECPVMKEWIKLEAVVSRATEGKIALMHGKNIDRTTVADNYELLLPLVANYGMRPSVSLLEDLVGRFLYFCRPRGKPLPKSDDIKTEAWILRNLVTVLAGAARRPHVPRCPEMRTLFRAIGIDVPENLAKEEDAGPGDDDDYMEDAEGGESEGEIEYDPVDTEVPDQPLAYVSEKMDPMPAPAKPLEIKPMKSSVGGKPDAPSMPRSSSHASLDSLRTPPPRSTMASPLSMSVAKHSPHVPMKCGYICLDCRESHINVDKILERKCGVHMSGRHSILKKAVQCMNCHDLGDTTEEFLKGECPGAKHSPVSKKLEIPASLSTGCDVESPAGLCNPSSPSPNDALRQAEQEMEKLNILKQLEKERLELQRLLSASMSGGISVDQLDTMPMVPEEMEFYSGIGDEKSVGAEKSPMTIPTVPPVPDGENPFEDTDEPEASSLKNEEMIPVEKFAGHADQILPASEPEDLPVPASSSGVASAKQHEQPSVEDSTHAKPPVVDSEDSLSPAEQSKLSGKAAPKQRGRPAKAKGKAKAKAEGKKREKASAKSKAKAKSKPKTLPDTEPASTSKPKKHTRAKAGSTEDDKAESATSKKSKKSEKIEKNTEATESLGEWFVRTAPAAAPKKKARKARKAASKAKLEASADKVDDTNSTKNDPAQKTLEELPAVVRTKRARKSKPSATDACPLPEPEHDRHSAAAATTSDKGTEAKQRNARKSAAYRRAQKAAKDNGMSPADCAAAGRKAYAETE